ncbi:MAG: alpha/beta hydrolase [Patescibacteria group bacterium]
MKQGYFDHNNGKIWYQTAGTGKPIVFIHGFTLDHRMWDTQVASLRGKHKIVTYDMRGFGKSSIPSSSYSHQDDLQSLLGHLSIKKAHVVGLSLGGEIALDFTLSFPRLVSSLTLVDSSLGGYRSTVDWNVHAQEVGLENAKQNWLQHEVFKPVAGNPEVFPLLEQMVNEYSGWHWLHKDPRKKLQPSAKDQLSKVITRAMIIAGEKDLPYFMKIAKILKTNIPNSTFHMIRGASHLGNIEKTSDFNQILSDFLAGESAL